MAKMDLKHEVVSAIKAVAKDLGHTPSRREFVDHRLGLAFNKIENAFGLWGSAVEAAGLEKHSPEKKKKKTSSLPNPELNKELASKIIGSYKTIRTIKLPSYNKILVIGDVHFPYCDKNALSMIYALIEKEKPDVVVQIGDLYDMLAYSRFPRSLNLMTPRVEINLAREESTEMWSKIRNLVPTANLFQVLGNHCVRPLKQVIDKWPEGEDLVSEAFKQLYTFEGVTTIYDSREELFIGDIAFIHGYRSKLGDHMNNMRCNVVTGHSHRGGTFFKPYNNGAIMWELNAGYIADPFSAALSYRAQKLHDWTVGCGLIDELGPRFIPFT